MWGAKPSTRLLPKQCLQSYDDGDRAAGAAQNVLDLRTKVQTALSRPLWSEKLNDTHAARAVLS
jgi:hypothetical protein